MQPAPQLARTNQIAPPRSLAGQPAAALSKALPDATAFGDQLARALAAHVATANPGAVVAAGQSKQPVPVAAAQVAAQQIAPVKSAPVQAAPDPIETVPVPRVGTLPLPPAVVTQQQPDGVAQRPRPTHADRRESNGAATAAPADAAGTDQPVAIATQPLPLVLPLPAYASLQAQEGSGNATAASGAAATSAIAAQAVGHVPGAKPTVADAASTDVQPAGTHVTTHRDDILSAPMQSVSDQPDTSQTTTAQATTIQATAPAAAPLVLHPLMGEATTAPTPASAAPASPANAQMATPAAQVASALVAMGHAPDGAQQLTMQLAPSELGQVQIRIDRPAEAPARVNITVEKTEALTLLLRNQPQAVATSAIAAQAVGHVPGAKPTVADAASTDVQSAGTHVTTHGADILSASMQSVSDQPGTSQSTTTQATTIQATRPAATPLVLHPLAGEAATAPAATSASAAPASPANAQVATPAAQAAPALVAMGHAPDGAQLAPPEPGQVQIRIDRPPEAPVRVDITVEKTEALTLLLRDQPELQHALDQAGVPPEGRSVTFHVVAPEPPTHMDATLIPSPAGATSNGLAGAYSQGASRQGGQSARQQQQTVADGSGDAAQVAAEQTAQQIAPVQSVPVQAAPDPVQTIPNPPVRTLPLPLAVVTQQQPDGVVQRPRPTQADRRESKGSTAATTTDAAGTDQPVAIATQPMSLALPLPIDATLQTQQGPGNATAAGDAQATSAISAQAVGHVPGANPAIVDATSSDVQLAGPHAPPHRADLVPASMQSGSDQPDPSQSTATQATTPAAMPLALHPLPSDAATASAAKPASAAPASAPNAHMASPAAQVAPALVAMGHAPDGAQRLTMRLAPPELGQVEIRIDRSPDAPARVDITVEKTETLTLLLRDQPQLLHALDQAGVPPEGRSVIFHIVAPEPPTRMDATSIPSPAGAASNGLAGEYSQSASRQGGQSSQQQQQTAADGSDEAAQANAAPPPWARWSRAGLDITA